MQQKYKIIQRRHHMESGKERNGGGVGKAWIEAKKNTLCFQGI